jgi:TATA-box binding protein (TBP) (component of TFIID and TFIIIB)
MFKSTLTKLGFLFIVAISFTACNKYDEGANFSLLTAKMRVVNHWKLTKITATNGNTTYDATSNFPSTILKIKDDNTYEVIYTVGNFNTTDNGTWEFNSDKTTLTATDNGGDITIYKIVKLKNKEMTLEYIDGSTTYTVEYTQDA